MFSILTQKMWKDETIDITYFTVILIWVENSPEFAVCLTRD